MANFQPLDFLQLDDLLSDEETLVRDSVRAFVEENVLPIIEDCYQDGKFPEQLIKPMGDLGYFGANLEGYGCAGLNNVAYGLIMQELERGDSGLRSFVSVQGALVMYPIHSFGSEDQKQRWLPKLQSGEAIGCFGLTEPDFGSNPSGLRTRARKDGDSYVLNGAKAWITNGGLAHVAVAWARCEDGIIRGFLVEKGTPGFIAGKAEEKMGHRASPTNELVFDNCVIPAHCLLGNEGEGFKIAMACLDNGRYTVAAGATGLIRACMEASVRYAQDRRAFGREIGKFQLIQQKIASMVQYYDAARLLYLRAGWLKNLGKRNTRETSLAKWFATDASFSAASEALQIHGAYGYSDEYDVERYLRNSKGAVIYEGTSEIHQLMQAGYALGYREDASLRCELPAYDAEYWQEPL